jgi:hypothetical protein
VAASSNVAEAKFLPRPRPVSPLAAYLAAEVEARQAKEELALVEEAIRKRLLCANPDADDRLTAVA